MTEIESLKRLVIEMNETETNVRNLLRPYMDVDGDSYGVPTLEELVENLIERIGA